MSKTGIAVGFGVGSVDRIKQDKESKEEINGFLSNYV